MNHFVAFKNLLLAVSFQLAVGAASANVDGSLDTSLHPPLGSFPFYGTPGLVDYALDFGGTAPTTNEDYAAAVLAQPDGRIVVAGRSWSTGSPVSSHVGVVARFLADGSADTAFGNGGFVVLGIAGDYDLYINSIAAQGQRLLVAAAYRLTSSPASEYAILFRLAADGASYEILAGGNDDLRPDHGFNKVVTDDAGNIYLAGHWDAPQGRRFEVTFMAPDGGGPGNESSFNRPLGNGASDGAIAQDLVWRRVPARSCGQGCLVPAHEELFVVGTAYMGSYPDGLANHDCAVAAFRKGLLDNFFSPDAGFNGGEPLLVDFPAGGTAEGDNLCIAIAPGAGSRVVIGGMNAFISTLGGGSPGLAGNYALAEVDESANVTRQDAFSFYQELATPGIYNSIYAMVREPGGRLVVAGYAGTSLAARAPADVGVIRFNADYSRDATFGNDGAGLAILSLDGQGTLASAQREYATALALDNHGRLVVAGNRSYSYGNSGDYDWLIARLRNDSDVIFRDGYDGVVPRS